MVLLRALHFGENIKILLTLRLVSRGGTEVLDGEQIGVEGYIGRVDAAAFKHWAGAVVFVGDM